MNSIFRRKSSIAAALVFAGLGLWGFLYYKRGERAVENYKVKMSAAGEKLSVDELRPKAVLPQQNSAGTFHQLLPLLNSPSLFDSNLPPAMRIVAPGKAMLGWAQPDVRGEATNSWEEVGDVLADQQELLELLHKIRERPVLDFQLDYHQGFSLLLPHLAPLKKSSQRLSAAAVYDLHRGDAGGAVTNLLTMLAIVEGMGEERLEISQLVRMALAHITVAATWEFLQSTNATEAELGALQREWMMLELSRPAENSLLMERAMGEAMIEQMRESSAEFRRVAGGWGIGSGGSGSGSWADQTASAAAMKTKEIMWRAAWANPDELRGLRGQEAVIHTLRQARAEGSFKKALQRQQTALAELGILDKEGDPDDGLFNFELDVRTLFSSSLRSLRRFSYRVLSIETARNMTVTAIALNRFRVGQGKFPQQLAELTPSLLPEVPRDPVDGEPLRYRLNPDGTFLLYSIGEDVEDNGGDATVNTKTKFWSWQKGKDWVWPRPASAEEIAKDGAKRYSGGGAGGGAASAPASPSPISASTNLPSTNSPQ